MHHSSQGDLPSQVLGYQAGQEAAGLPKIVVGEPFLTGETTFDRFVFRLLDPSGTSAITELLLLLILILFSFFQIQCIKINCYPHFKPSEGSSQTSAFWI